MFRLACLLLGAAALWSADDFFETSVRPVLARNCQGCHPTKEHFLKAAANGKLIPAIRREGALKMPPNGALEAPAIAAIEKWVAQGAVWPADKKPAAGAHWAFQPVKPVPSSIDELLQTASAASAPPLTLIRRLSLVLTGLPPTEDEVRRYSSMAYPQIVDAILASPHYGERWARHWMDVVRFAETHGYEWNYEIQGAWRYRDYLIRAFNENLPYNQLVREHIAGDLLPNARPEAVTGTAFFRLGEAGHDDCIEFRSICLDVIDNQIDTLGKAFQGLTISCARCHDHKIDPIPTADYHALLGVLESSRQVIKPLENASFYANFAQKTGELKAKIRTELAGLWLQEWSPGQSQPLSQPPPDAASDFTPFEGWLPDGPGLTQVQPGDFALETEGEDALTAIFPKGWFTNATSDKLSAAMRSPLLPKDKKYISLLVSGGKLAARRTVIDNGVIGENYDPIQDPVLHWLKLPTLAEQKNYPVWIELVTKTQNPRIPDRPGRLKASKEALASDRSWFGFVRAVVHDVDRKPPLFSKIPDTRAAIQAWGENRATDDDALWLNWLLQNGLLTNSRHGSATLEALIGEYRALEATIPAPRVVSALTDGSQGVDFPVFPYGDWKSPGKIVPRGYLSLFGKLDIPANSSGRLQLAEAIATPDNPLTARVMVNRLWHWIFGRGIVPTVDNFGRVGEPPSNPALLDHLASRFVQDNWNIKNLVREIVLSKAFQSRNYPVHRLDAEAVRDSILATSGRLDRRLYGESVSPFRETPKEYRRLFAGPLDGEGRRSIYLKVTRMEWSQFLETFDFPAPLTARGARDVTNVPAQALALLNDPFVIEQAGVWADALLRDNAASPEERLESMVRRAFGRPATPAEIQNLRQLVAQLADPDHVLTNRTVWKHVAHTLFNLKEFIYIP